MSKGKSKKPPKRSAGGALPRGLGSNPPARIEAKKEEPIRLELIRRDSAGIEPASTPPPEESETSSSWRSALKFATSPWALGTLGIALVVALVLARSFNFILEDSFISLRYARNVFRGFGPVYNPGEEPVEGYTNFLWMLLWSASFFFTDHPEKYFVLSNRIFGALLITAVWWELIRRGQVGRRWLWLGVFLLALHQTIHSWMSGGLETHFYVFLTVCAVGRFLREEFSPAENPYPLSAGIMPLVLLTRPDGYITGLICGLVMVGRRLWPSNKAPGGWRRVAIYGGACALIGGSHILWRRLYYHDWLPNTFRAKVSGAWWSNGFKYVDLFYKLNYFHWGVIAFFVGLAILAVIVDRRHPFSGQLFTVSLIIAAFTLYLAYVGGDLFEFRLLEPAVAMIALLVPMTLEWLSGKRARWTLWTRLTPALSAAGAIVGVVLLGRLFFIQQTRPYKDKMHGYGGVVAADTFQALIWLDRLRPFAEWLKRYAAPKERLATGVAGVVPYYSDLPTLDTLGLNDRYVAKMKIPERTYLGHEKMAPREYLGKSGVVYFFDVLIALPPPESPYAWDTYKNDSIIVQAMDGGWRVFDTFVDPGELRRTLRERGAIVWPGPQEDKTSAWSANKANWQKFEAAAAEMGYHPQQFKYTPPAPRDPSSIGAFDDKGWDGWLIGGEAFSMGPTEGPLMGQTAFTGKFGGGVANSFHPTKNDGATGELISPDFTPQPGQTLSFSVGGGSGENLGVSLIGPQGEIKTWRGENSENLRPVSIDLTPWAGQPLRVRIFDNAVGPWGHVLADGFVLQ